MATTNDRLVNADTVTCGDCGALCDAGEARKLESWDSAFYCGECFAKRDNERLERLARRAREATLTLDLLPAIRKSGVVTKVTCGDNYYTASVTLTIGDHTYRVDISEQDA